MAEISLFIGDQKFKVNKEVLSVHSDYFRVMFNGSYVENEQNEIFIDVVDANSMKIILQYMEIGLIDLSGLPLSTIKDVAMAANFLQITELLKQIEYTLELKLTVSNWMEIMAIAENTSYIKLEQLAAAFGLFSFKDMQPNYIPTIQKLFWYLSHPCLDASSELDVYKFGNTWISHSETGADALMIVLGCLDIKKLTKNDIDNINNLIKEHENSLAAKVVECLALISVQKNELSMQAIIEQKVSLCEAFTERVYNEVVNLVKESKSRTLCLIPTVPMWSMKHPKPESAAHYLYTFSEKTGFESWLEVAEKHLWGWSITSWGLNRLVVACGEHGRGTGLFMRDVKVYDTLKKEWIQHGVQLPHRRHAGLAVVGDSLFIIGGVGGFRVILDSSVIYDLKRRTHRSVANLPDAIQSPAICSHEGHIYAAGHNNIYRYEDCGQKDQWVRVVGTDIRMSCMVSYKGSIYCIQNFFSYLYVFKPDVSDRLEMIANFSNPPAAICNLGNRLIFFTRSMCSQSDFLNSVEEYTRDTQNESPRTIWNQTKMDVQLNDVSGACSLVMTMPLLHKEISQYHNKYLARYTD